MHALMMAAKMIHRVAEAKISEDERFSNLSGPRLGVLFMLHEAGSIRMGDAATKLCVAPRTVTDLVDGLERDGYVQRVPDPKDRRAFLLRLTDTTQANMEKLAHLKKKFVGQIFAPLDEEERATLVKILTKLTDSHLGGLADECNLD